MKVIDFHTFTRRQPFAPFRMHVSDGRVYDIHHPDQLIALPSRVVVAVAGDDDVVDRTEHIAMNHVVRLEEFAEPTVNGH